MLDLIRAAAILLVLMQHAGGPEWTRFGWIGVDLFFVLSGFLVTRLLLTEFRERGTADSVRFLIRRGFKIYPAFWAMLLASLGGMWAADCPPRPLAALCELLFVQNYGPGLWVHTWSLAVEEHFYLFLAAVFWRPWVPRWMAANSRRLAVIFLAVCLFVATVRIGLAVSLRPDLKMLRWGTHARFDALLCGAALAYCFEFCRAELESFLEGRRTAVLLSSACVLAAGVLIPESSQFWLLGYSLLPWAFAAIVAYSLIAGLPDSVWTGKPVCLLAAIGRYSYGIYLWHIPLNHLLLQDVIAEFNMSAPVGAIFYFAASVGAGVLMSAVIEAPFLGLRDRFFPSRKPVPANVAAMCGLAQPQRIC